MTRNLCGVEKFETKEEFWKIYRYFRIFTAKSVSHVADLCCTYEVSRRLLGAFYWFVAIHQSITTFTISSNCQFYPKEFVNNAFILSRVDKVFNKVTIKLAWRVPQIWIMRVSSWKKHHIWVTFDTNNNLIFQVNAPELAHSGSPTYRPWVKAAEQLGKLIGKLNTEAKNYNIVVQGSLLKDAVKLISAAFGCGIVLSRKKSANLINARSLLKEVGVEVSFRMCKR